MTSLDDRILPKVLALIAKVGVTATLKDRATTQSAGGSPTITTTDRTITVTPPMKLRESLGGNDMGQTSDGIRETERMECYVAGQGLAAAPERLDRLVIGSTTWTIVAVRELWSGASVAAYVMEVR